MAPEDETESCGGYWCYDWAIIWENAIKKKLKCFAAAPLKYYYDPGNRPNPKKYDPKAKFRVHAFLALGACGRYKFGDNWIQNGYRRWNSKCIVMVDDRFLDGKFVHSPPWPHRAGETFFDTGIDPSVQSGVPPAK